jgi:excisionase family DNA binding protein
MAEDRHDQWMTITQASQVLSRPLVREALDDGRMLALRRGKRMCVPRAQVLRLRDEQQDTQTQTMER